MKLSVIVPCYNESDNLPEIYKQFYSAFKDLDNVEIILVNNGSTDKSGKIMAEMNTRYSSGLFKVINIFPNEGYGNGILKGLESAQGEVLAWTHADLQTDPADVRKGYEIYLKEKNPDVFVKGRRKGRGFIPDLFTRGMQITATFALKTNLEDIGAQPKIFSKKFFREYLLNKAPKDFSLDLYAQYWAKQNGTIIEFPVIMKKRQFGEAKGGGSWKTRIKVSRRTFKFILEMRKQLTE